MYVMGIDVGTSGVKCLLIDEKGTVAAETTKPYPIHSPRPSWFEQEPEDWWNGAVEAIREVLDSVDAAPGDISGIGLTGQYHGLVILDKDGKVLRRSILWNDQRTAAQAAYLSERAGREKLLKTAATAGAPYFTACKLQWVKDNEPGVYERVHKMMLPKDYIRYRLTGEFATDVSDASGTLFLDVPGRRWSDELPSLMGFDSSILPKLVESPEVSGTVARSAAETTGLEAGTPVAGGAGDQAAAAVGLGIVEEGYITYSIGTSGVIYAATDTVRIDADSRVNTFCHAVPGTWCLLSCTNAAAGSYQWYREKLAAAEESRAKESGRDVYTILEEEAKTAPLGSDYLFFLPYLAGERHPHTDTNARGVFFGLHTEHGRPHLIRAVLEGVAYSFRDCLEIHKEHGVRIDEIRATGGGAKSPLWMDIMVNVSGQSIVMMEADQGGAAFGACILGGVAAGTYASVPEACEAIVRTGRRLDPDPAKRDAYQNLFSFYRTLYPVLRESYGRLAELSG